MKLSDTVLRKLVDQDGSEMLEFKESFDHETIETVGAFANTRGGIIHIRKTRGDRERDIIFSTKWLKGVIKESQKGQVQKKTDNQEGYN